MEKFIKSALANHWIENSISFQEQHGFKRGRSCLTNLLLAREVWCSALDNGLHTDVIFVDFSKAFDRVPHRRLLVKMQQLGVTGALLNWIEDFLTDRPASVKVNDHVSASFTMTSGVPQGSVLGPELFKCFLYDLPSRLPANCLIYADDLKLWVTVADHNTPDVLQSELDELNSWSEDWCLPINQAKCSVLPVGSQLPLSPYHLRGTPLRVSNEERDLGIITRWDLLSCSDTAKKVAAANRAFQSIRRAFSRLTVPIFLRIFSEYIRPVLEFGGPASYPLTLGEADKIEGVQRRATKRIQGFFDLSYEERLVRLDLFSMGYRRLRGDLIVAWRIVHGFFGEEIRQFFALRGAEDQPETRSNGLKLFKPRRRRLRVNFSLSTRVVNEWNLLPHEAVVASSVDTFKKRLDQHFRDMGRCFAVRP